MADGLADVGDLSDVAPSGKALVAHLVDDIGQQLLVGEGVNRFGHVRVVGPFELAFEIGEVPLRPQGLLLEHGRFVYVQNHVRLPAVERTHHGSGLGLPEHGEIGAQIHAIAVHSSVAIAAIGVAVGNQNEIRLFQKGLELALHQVPRQEQQRLGTRGLRAVLRSDEQHRHGARIGAAIEKPVHVPGKNQRGNAFSESGSTDGRDPCVRALPGEFGEIRLDLC